MDKSLWHPIGLLGTFLVYSTWGNSQGGKGSQGGANDWYAREYSKLGIRSRELC